LIGFTFRLVTDSQEWSLDFMRNGQVAASFGRAGGPSVAPVMNWKIAGRGTLVIYEASFRPIRLRKLCAAEDRVVAADGQELREFTRKRTQK
jgi:hypothetical protein